MTSRVVSLEGAYNCRDLGGYEASDGRRLRWGRLYRSDALSGATSSDIEQLRDLGIRTLIDLRSPSEISYTGYGILADEPIRIVDFDVSASTRPGSILGDASPSSSRLANRYLEYLRVGPGAIVGALRELAVEEHYPVIVSCFFGKDRTGVTVALLLDLLGVARQTIAQEYALSTSGTAARITTLRRDPVYGDTLDRTEPFLLTSDASTILEFLDGVDQRCGGARSWALSTGLTSDEFVEIEAALLE